MYGGTGHDQVYGETGNDKLYGEAGNDTLFGGDDLDVLFGGDGNDVLNGESGIDQLYGEAGNDYLSGGVGNDFLYGGMGDDFLVAAVNDGDDVLNGGDATDKPDASNGTDTVVYKYDTGDSTILITGESKNKGQKPNEFGLSIGLSGGGDFGNDTLVSIEQAAVEAGSGKDTLVINGDSKFGKLSYIDLGGQASSTALALGDVLDAKLATTSITVDLRDASNQKLSVNDGYYFFNSTLTLRNVENVEGTDFGDTIYGVTSTGSRLNGYAGNDTITGGDQADEINGGSGDDILEGGGGSDTLDGGNGADILVVDGADIIARGEVEDKLYLKSYNALTPWINKLRGGQRTVIVTDAMTRDQQIQAMLNSTAKYTGGYGEQYEITGSGATQGLKITMKSNEVIFSVNPILTTLFTCWTANHRADNDNGMMKECAA